MGLEMVDVVLRTERAFQIAISDEEAIGAVTVGQLYKIVLSKLPGAQPGACLSSVAFYRVRRALEIAFNTPRSDVMPDSDMESLIPRENRRAAWKAFRRALGFNIPGLWHPFWLTNILARVYLAAAALVALSLFLSLFGCVPWTVSLVGVCVIFGMHVATIPAANRMPWPCRTVRGLVDYILAHNYASLTSEVQNRSKADVWETLRAIIVDSLKIDPDEVTMNARWVADLGAG